MTIKQVGGIFGRNPTYNNTVVEGNFSVGTANPQRVFHVNSGAVDICALFESTDNPVVLSFWNGEGGGNIKVDQSNFNFRTGGNSTGAGGTNRLTVASSGDVTVETGNLVIGTSGQGIDFSATSGTGTSELFDDYEEGTWTPTLFDASSGGNEASYAKNTGYYTKIGRNVYCTFNLQSIDTTGMTSGNNIHIKGLPFSVINVPSDTQNFSQNAVCINVTAAHTPYISLDDNADFMYLLEWDGTSANSLLKISDITSGTGRIMCSFWYTSY